MAEFDYELGKRVNKMLMEKGLETPMFPDERDRVSDNILVESKFADLMEYGLGLDMENDSLKDTPRRVAKMFCDEVFYGLDYKKFPKCTTVENTMGYDEVVSGRTSVKSVCEHHFVPFIGVANVAYIPGGKVLGLSKFNRIVDFFSRRPQIQERLTEQVSAALCLILETEDIAITITAEHYCVHLRGVQDSVSRTTTSKIGGRFRDNASLRAEFFALTR